MGQKTGTCSEKACERRPMRKLLNSGHEAVACVFFSSEEGNSKGASPSPCECPASQFSRLCPHRRHRDAKHFGTLIAPMMGGNPLVNAAIIVPNAITVHITRFR